MVSISYSTNFFSTFALLIGYATLTNSCTFLLSKHICIHDLGCPMIYACQILTPLFKGTNLHKDFALFPAIFTAQVSNIRTLIIIYMNARITHRLESNKSKTKK